MTDIKVITWNIDGLNPVETIKRTLEVCKIIKKEAPDVVLLQEVLNCTLNLISEECPDYIFLDAIEEGYTCLDENDENEDGSDDDDEDDDDDESIDDGILGGYFCITMLKRETVEVKEARVIPFTNSKQGRCLQKIECIIRGIPFVVMSSHFESCKAKSDERKHQFKRTLSHMINSKPDATVIFGGDTNLRNYEVKQIKGIPSSIVDVWEAMGSSKETEYTWDTAINKNLSWSSTQKTKLPRIRFDRFYLRQPKIKRTVEPTSFTLIGQDIIPGTSLYPSDHWGILLNFSKIDTFLLNADSNAENGCDSLCATGVTEKYDSSLTNEDDIRNEKGSGSSTLVLGIKTFDVSSQANDLPNKKESEPLSSACEKDFGVSSK